MEWSRKRMLILVTAIAVIVSLVTLLVFVPLVFGEQFVSYSPRLVYIMGPELPGMEVVYINGSLIKVCRIIVEVKWTNSYFMPVQVSYNGFDYVVLVYNCTVTEPSDVVSNQPFLVWGAFYHFPGIPWSFDEQWGEGDPYNYYVTRRNLSNYTKTIDVGASSWTQFYASWGPHWCGQDLSGNAISPGIYYIYPIVYGKTLEPMSLNVTSIWPW